MIRKKKLLNYRPMLFIALSLTAGIISFFGFCTEKYVFAVCSTCLFIFIISFFFIFYSDKETVKKNTARLISLIIAFLLGGTVAVQINSYKSADLNNHYFTVNAKIVSVKETDYGSYIILSDAKFNGNKSDYKISLTVLGENGFDIGDYVSFYSLITDRDIFYDGKFSGYAIDDKIKYSASVPANDITFIKNDKTVFETVNVFLRETLKKGLSDNVFPIGYALIAGNSESIDAETLDGFRSAGVAHIFAVSGLHIGFFALALSFILKRCHVNKTVRFIIVILGCLFYSGVCGFSASSVRATVMTAILYLSTALGERYDGLSSISLSYIIVLLISPVQLFCAGFLLSFGVVTGINLLAKPIGSVFKFLPEKISSAIGVTVSAQLVSIPISLYFFGYFSWIAVICNLLFIPVVGVIYIAILAGTLIGSFISPTVLLFLPNIFLKLINTLITAFDYKIFIVGGIGLGATAVFYYSALILPCGLFNIKKNLKIAISSSLCVIFFITAILYNTLIFNAPKLYVFGKDTMSAVILSDKDENTMIVADVSHIFSVSELRRVVKNNNIDKLNKVIVMQDGIDLQVFITKLNSAVSVESLYYFGAKDESMEKVVKASFKDIKLYHETEGIKFYSGGEYEFILSGKAIKFSVDGKSVGVFGKFGDGCGSYRDENERFDIIVCYDYAENINAVYSPEEIFCFTPESGIKNCARNGYLTVKIA